MASSSPSESLVPATSKDDSNNKMIEQTLGGHAYRIDPSEVSSQLPLWKLALKGGAVLLLSPVLVPTVVVCTASMCCGPSWWRHKVTSFLIRVTMGQVAELFDGHRRELLQNLESNHAVLDLGAGAGHYLKYLRVAKRLVALEPVANLHGPYLQKAKEVGMNTSQIELYASVMETYLQDHPEAKASFDWIILGNVLCEVDDQQSTLQCVNQLLKPGGYVHYSEHVASPKGTWQRS